MSKRVQQAVSVTLLLSSNAPLSLRYRLSSVLANKLARGFEGQVRSIPGWALGCSADLLTFWVTTGEPVERETHFSTLKKKKSIVKETLNEGTVQSKRPHLCRYACCLTILSAAQHHRRALMKNENRKTRCNVALNPLLNLYISSGT